MDDAAFMRNVLSARENGQKLVCAECGEGHVVIDPDDGRNHVPDCPNGDSYEDLLLAERLAG